MVQQLSNGQRSLHEDNNLSVSGAELPAKPR